MTFVMKQRMFALLFLVLEKFRKMNINKRWHEKNKMPANPSFEERVKWHLAHRENCSCRPIPEKLVAEMKKRGIKV